MTKHDVQTKKSAARGADPSEEALPLGGRADGASPEAGDDEIVTGDEEATTGDDGAATDGTSDVQTSRAEVRSSIEIATIRALELELDDLRRQLDERSEEQVRLLAELDNVRKRGEREGELRVRRAREQVLSSLLPAIDDVERALQAIHDHADPDDERMKPVLEGIALIHRRLLEALAQHDVRPMEPVGEPFNPHEHEAVMGVDSDEHEPDSVVQVLETGYYLGETVLRPARVAVSTGEGAQKT